GRFSFDAAHAGRHLPFDHDTDRPVTDEGRTDAAVQIREVFTVAAVHFAAVPLERVVHAEAGQVLLRVAGDGHVVVVDEQFHVQVLRHREPGGFRVVAFHL